MTVDCAAAITGFAYDGGWPHPIYDGFIICEEFEEIVTQAWFQEQEDAERKEREKLEKRVYGNWRKLIKGLFIRARLQAKYNFMPEDDDFDEEPKMEKGKPKKKK